MPTKKSDVKPAAKKASAKKAESQAPAPVEAKSEPKAPATKLAKTHIVDLLSKQASLSKRDAAQLFDAFGEVVVEALRSGQTVGLPGLGTFSVAETKARSGVRPGTSERITVPGCVNLAGRKG